MFFLHFQSSAVWNSRSSRKLEEWLADWPLTLDGLLLSKGSELHPNRPCRQNISRLSTNHQVKRLERSGPRKEMSPMAQILALIWSWFWSDMIMILAYAEFFFILLFDSFCRFQSGRVCFSNFLKFSQKFMFVAPSSRRIPQSDCEPHRPGGVGKRPHEMWGIW